MTKQTYKYEDDDAQARERGMCGYCRMEMLCGADGDCRAGGRPLRQRRLQRGQLLYRAGDRLRNIYFVKFGTLKMRAVLAQGDEQIIAFPMENEPLGLDGVALNQHTCDAVAIEDSLVCNIPVRRIQVSCMRSPLHQQFVNTLLGHEINREQHLLLMLGKMNSQARLAAFLLDISRRRAANGRRGDIFDLNMTRQDIGNHLGMTLETVSRLLSRLKSTRVLAIDQRQVCILDQPRLRELAEGRHAQEAEPA